MCPVPENHSQLAKTTTFSHPASLLIWLGLQLLVLLLPVMQVQLSDEFPRPAEKLAIEEMIVAQIALSALLFPVLIRDFASAIVMAATTWPILLLAGLLSSTPPYRLLESGIFISIWTLGLGLLRVDSAKWNAWTCAIVSTIAIGSAIAAYLREEFSNGNINGLVFGPIVGALDVVHGSEDRWKAWPILPIFLMAGAVLRIVYHRLRTRSRQLIHTFGG